MCGIVGYLGDNSVTEILLDGLKKLEYRGYDSAGIAVQLKNKIYIKKTTDKVDNLKIKAYSTWGTNLKKANIGIAHTRWATHGPPTEENAHPHISKDNISIVHNGIIENYKSLKKSLIKKGYTFISDTDTEVLCHLINSYYIDNLLLAVTTALKEIKGTYAIIVLHRALESLIIAKSGSPLLIGKTGNEIIVASDISPIIEYTNEIIYLEDNDIAELTLNDIKIYDYDSNRIERKAEILDIPIEKIDKNGYDHFMLKEINEQPEVLSNTARNRINYNKKVINILDEIDYDIKRIQLFGCGTSLNAALVGKYFFEELSKIPTTVYQSAEYRYTPPISEKNTIGIAISQSGETADTIAAVHESLKQNKEVISICNVLGSTIPRISTKNIFLHAGSEISVASTKAFTSQVLTLLLISMQLGNNKDKELYNEIKNLPKFIKKVLKQNNNIKKIAKRFSKTENMFYIGRNYMYPVAIEGALKLKEISYIHAEGYHSAELKHGPIALLDENTPVLALANNIPEQEKLINNIQECVARKSPIILTVTDGDTQFSEFKNIIKIPKSSKFIATITTSIALQLLAYHIANFKGCSIDQPKNLAKSVTVE
jgi:glucosamine--fructose-6-phosphate aminotransferase (isomerizing)